jgi:hypothetical protein
MEEDSMRNLTKFLIAGTGALAIGGVAIAASNPNHVMNVVMPDGSVAHIHYVGDVAPKVVVAPDEAAMPVAFMAADPFAIMDRISYEMDRRMDAMMQQASLMANAAPAASGQLSEAALKSLPAGTVSYSFTSYSSGNGGSCSQSVQVTSLGQNQAPKVVKQSQGDCSAMNSRKATPAVQQAKPAAAPVLTPASLEKPKDAVAKGPVI